MEAPQVAGSSTDSWKLIAASSKPEIIERYDIIIIGSGPAGCSAAMTCHQAGLKVLLVTQRDLKERVDPTLYAPIESIHPGVISLLEKIGAAEAVTSASRGTYTGIYASAKYTALGEDESGVWEGHHIQRNIFDAVLLERAIAQGVTVHTNETVQDFVFENERITGIETSSGKYLASYVIDASGKKSFAGKKLNFQQVFYSPPLLCWTGVSSYSKPFPFETTAAHFIPGQQGWSWLAPLPPGYCGWTQLSIRGEKSMKPPDELADNSVVGEVEFGNMRWRRFQPVCKEGLLICGDAAGILDPAAGQGIFNALLSGNIAAQCVVMCMRQSQYEAFHLARFNEWFVQHFEEKVEQLRDYYSSNSLSILNQTT